MRLAPYTPGPWAIEHARDKFDSSNDVLKIVETKPEPITIASINVRAFAPHLLEPEATARLIAAAPDLLEKLAYLEEFPLAMQNPGFAAEVRLLLAKATQP